MSRSDSARWILFSNYGSLALGLLTAPVVARALGASGRGDYAVILATGPAVAIVAGLGVPWASRIYLGRGPRDAQAVVASATVISRASIPPVGVFGFLLGYAILGELTPAICVCLYMLAVGSAVSRSTYGSVLLFTRRWKLLAAYSFAPSAISAGGVLLLSAFDRLTVSSALVVNAVGLLSQVFWYRGTSSGRVSVIELLKEGMRAWPLQIAEILYIRSDQLALYVLMGSTAAGLYSVAALGVQLSFFVVNALASPIFLLTSSTSEFHIRSKTAHAVSTALGTLVVLWLCAEMVGPVVIPIVFGPEFRSASALIPAAGFFSLAAVLWYMALHLTLLRGGLGAVTRGLLTLLPLGTVGMLALYQRTAALSPGIVVTALAITEGLAGLIILQRVHKVPLSALVPRVDRAAKFFFGKRDFA